MTERVWNVYLSGEIHSDWRERIATGIAEAGLPVRLDAPICVHEDSDDCGVTILGAEASSYRKTVSGLISIISKGTRPLARIISEAAGTSCTVTILSCSS